MNINNNITYLDIIGQYCTPKNKARENKITL